MSKYNMDTSNNLIISYQECKSIVSRYLQSDNFEVLNYKVQPFSDTIIGYLGDHRLLKITYCANGRNEEVSFFAKQFPSHNKWQKRFALEVKVFTREILTYEVLFDNFKQVKGFRPDFAPKYYFGKDNDIIVLEDLSAKGFVIPQNETELSINHIELGLKVLAQFHAGSIGYQEVKSKEIGKKYQLIDEYSEYMEESLFTKSKSLGHGWYKARLSALKAIINLIPTTNDISRDAFKEKLTDLAEQSIEILKPGENHYNAFCHGDMWANNVMFRYENGVPVECKLIDFQMQRYCPPAQDVLHFIYLTSSNETRKHHLHKLLHYYHECLRKELQNVNLDLDKIISYEQFEISVHYLLPQIKLQTAFYYSVQCASSNFYKKLLTNVNDYKKFVYEDGAPFSIELFKAEDNYKIAMTETLEELKDFIMNSMITLEDCFNLIENVLKTTQYQLLSRSLVPITRKKGFLGDHYKLKINVLVYDCKRTLNFFVKCIPQNKTNFDIVLESHASVKESFFYQKFVPLIQSLCIDEIEECIVTYYLIRLNDVLILEDMENHQFVSTNLREPFDVEHLKVIIRKLAIYHAVNIITEEKLSYKLSKIFRLDTCFAKELAERFFISNDSSSSLVIKTGIKAVNYEIDLFPDPKYRLPQQDFKKKAKRAFEAAYKLSKPSKKYRNVVCHGDLWASNIMMKYTDGKPVDCRIIDYQLIRYCPPAHDLLCLLYIGTNRKVRSEAMPQLIDFYYEVFKSVVNKYGCNANEIYSRLDFIASCEYLIPQAVCQAFIYHHFATTNNHLMSEYIVDEEINRKIFLEDRRDFISFMCQRDVVYKEKIEESIQDLREMCVKYF